MDGLNYTVCCQMPINSKVQGQRRGIEKDLMEVAYSTGKRQSQNPTDNYRMIQVLYIGETTQDNKRQPTCIKQQRGHPQIITPEDYTEKERRIMCN